MRNDIVKACKILRSHENSKDKVGNLETLFKKYFNHNTYKYHYRFNTPSLEKSDNINSYRTISIKSKKI